MSCTRSSRVGTLATGSEAPVPGLSKMIRRLNDESRRSHAVTRGSVQYRSMLEMKPGAQSRSTGPSPRT